MLTCGPGCSVHDFHEFLRHLRFLGNAHSPHGAPADGDDPDPGCTVAAAAPAKRDDQILIQGIVAGSQTVTARGTDSVRAARISPAGSVSLPAGNGSSSKLTQYEITGLDFSPILARS
jgi:hypothetical protein